MFIGCYALYCYWRERRDGALLAWARAQFNDLISTGWSLPAALEADLCRLPFETQMKVLAELAGTLEGEHRNALRRMAGQLGLVARAEGWCRARSWAGRLRGARVLTITGGSASVMRPLLQDCQPEVRAQAAEWAAAHGEPEVVTDLLHLLSDPAGLCRFTVQDALLCIGMPAVEPLARYLTEQTGTAASPALAVAGGFGNQRFLPAALAHSESAYPGVRAAAAQLLGSMGGGNAIERLLALLRDRNPVVRVAALRALAHLGHWPAAPKAASLLKDSSWQVRREAGLALRRLGAPGLLMLRKALSSPDTYAAEMAQHVLDLPAPARGQL